MREPTRYSLSGALSILAHAVFVLLFAWSFAVEPEPDFDDEVPDFDIDFIEFDVKEIEPDKAQGEPEPEPEEPEPDPPEPEDAAPPPIEQPEDPNGEATPPPPEPEPEAKPKFGEKSSKIRALVPPNATWTLVLANSRIKKLPFRDSATELMAPLRDFRLLVDDGGFNIWEDFEYVVMGSPDATDQTQAFVAVQYKFGHDEMKAAIDRSTKKHGMVVDWREEEGVTVGDPRYRDEEIEARNPDDRQFVLLPGDNVALYLREAFIPQVIAGPDPSKGKTSANFVANIAKIKRFAYAEPKAGIQLVVEDLRRMIRVGENFPFEIPSRAEVMWEAAKNPELVIKLDFLEQEHAQGAFDYWHNQLEADLRQLKAWDVAGGFIAATTVELDKRTLIIRHAFNETSARVVLDMGADAFAKAMNYSRKRALEAKAEREKMWEMRNGGKLLPSEVLAALEEEESRARAEAKTRAEAEAEAKAKAEAETGGEPEPKPDEPKPDEPKPSGPEAPAEPEPEPEPAEPEANPE